MIENDGLYSICVVERDTGIGRDTLRVWDRRYGFPEPVRSEKGERKYSEKQLPRISHQDHGGRRRIRVRKRRSGAKSVAIATV